MLNNISTNKNIITGNKKEVNEFSEYIKKQYCIDSGSLSGNNKEYYNVSITEFDNDTKTSFITFFHEAQGKKSGKNREKLKNEQEFKKIQNEEIRELIIQNKKDQVKKDKAYRAIKTIKELVLQNNLRFMLTLTYGEKFPQNRGKAINDFKKFIQRLNYRLSDDIKYVAVMEVQQKRLKKYGDRVLHFHLAIDRPLNIDHVTQVWGNGWAFIKTKKSECKEKSANYMVKYLKKDIENISGSGEEQGREKQNEKRYLYSKGLKRPLKHCAFISQADLKTMLLMAEIEGILDFKKDYEGLTYAVIKYPSDIKDEFIKPVDLF